ncbi:hypothetical protein AB6864_00960 [Serratia proteamaculans]|uniref:hypothetical protein n=1 Tax=Serratia proteamaculans TaxID=28151 RepID=UPI0039BEC0DE
MIVSKARTKIVNSSLPVLNLSPEEEFILRKQPSGWISSANGLISDDGTNVKLILDRGGNENWAPLMSNMPRKAFSNGKLILNFGTPGGVPSPTNNGSVISQNGHEALPANGVMTVAALYRIPTGLTGGNLFGNNAAVPDRLRAKFGTDGYGGTNVWINHGTESPISDNNYPINAAFSFRDNAWHIALIEINAGMHRWEHDGTLLQQKSVGAIPFTTADSRRLVVGSAGNPIATGFVGDLAELLVIPSTIDSVTKTVIYSWLNARKASLTV